MADETSPQTVGQQGPAAAPAAVKKAGNGKALLKITDPHGFVIEVDLDTWEKHIVPNHPEMKDHLDLLGKTLEQPQVIQHSDQRNETYYYYRLTGRSIFRRDDIYLSAVVYRNNEVKTGFVKTAHLVKSIRQGGETIWTRRN